MKRAALTLLAAAMLVPANHALAASRTNAPAVELAGWQAKEARLFTIGWRLVTGNAPFCANASPALGLLLHDAGSYAQPAQVQAALGLHGPIGVQAVAPGSPAYQAGLMVNDTLVSVAGIDLSSLPSAPATPWRRLAGINDRLEESLRRDGQAALTWRDRSGRLRQARVSGRPACPTRFELLSGNDRVVADGTRVLLGEQFVGFTYADELLAAAIAHELAHNLQRHRVRLDRAGRSQRNVRETEREADRMMPWLLVNAGYPPQTAADFMRRWGPVSPAGAFGGIMRARSHDGWDERAALIQAELPKVAASMAADGRADWRPHFKAAAAR